MKLKLLIAIHEIYLNDHCSAQCTDLLRLDLEKKRDRTEVALVRIREVIHNASNTVQQHKAQKSSEQKSQMGDNFI